ncbi:MAG: metallophosphoesterase [Desulfobulbaceae bacterium]|nr:metallophosphoesterase [Desulfobulbaceae bacterium]
MKKLSYPIFVFWLPAVVLVAICVQFAALTTTARADVTIGVIGDQFGVDGMVGTPQFNSNLKASYQALADGVAALNQAGPMDVALHMGDLVESTMTDSDILTNFNNANGTLNKLESKSIPKWFMTAGDHDVNPTAWTPDSPDRSKETYFQSLYAKVNPLVSQNLFYSFNVNGYHFVSLYALEHLDTDPRWGNVFFAQLSEAQLDWLQKDLAAADTGKGVIVFIHQPLWYNWSSWQRVHAILARYNTKAVVSAHVHYDQTEYQLDGIQYRIVGATGGSIKDANPAAGGWWHVARLTITDAGAVTWQLIPVGNYVKNNFTDRYDMDRVQALAYNLGNAAQWLAQQKLYVKDGVLVDKTCQQGSTPTIILSEFGNPIDQAVFMGINLKNTPGYKISAGKFADGLCESPELATGCRMHPSANIAVSNNSLVSPTCGQYSADYIYCTGYAPFWTGAVTAIQPPKAGDKLTFTLPMSYYAQSGGAMMIHQDVEVLVEACP